MSAVPGKRNSKEFWVLINLHHLPAARIEKNFFIFVEVVTLIFVPHMGEVVKHSKVRSIEGVKSTPGWIKLGDFKDYPIDSIRVTTDHSLLFMPNR